MPGIGGVIGSAIGSAIDASFQHLPDQTGPRLSDLKVTTSAYGSTIPIVYGSSRLSGNIIWSTDLIEHQTDTESGGKGGPSQTTTTFSYTVSCAVSICEGVMFGVRKIYADGRLIYDINATTVPTIINGVTYYSETTNLSGLNFTFYQGTDVQNPDATMEAVLGVGNVTAYRGQCYVVFTDLPLDNFGNRIPSFTFEVMSSANDKTGNLISDVVINTLNTVLLPLFWPLQNIDVEQKMVIYRGPTEKTTTVYSDGTLGPDGVIDENTVIRPRLIGDTDFDAGFVGSSRMWQRSTSGDIAIGNVGNPILPFGGVLLNHNSTNVQATGKNGIKDFTQYLPLSETGRYLHSYAIFTDRSKVLLCTSVNPLSSLSSADRFFIISSVGGVVKSGTISPSLDYMVLGMGSTDYARDNILAFNSLDYGWSVWNDSRQISLLHIDKANNMTATLVASGLNGRGQPIAGAKGGYLYAIAASNNEALSDVLVASISPQIPNPVLLSDIVKDISVRSGLSLSDLDTTELTDYVDGYVITRQTEARICLEQLAQTYFFDVVESDNKLKFVKRGHSSLITIESDDLAAASDEKAIPDILTTTRQQEIEIPKTIAVVYSDFNTDYQQASQQSKKIVASTGQTSTIQVPIVLTADKALQMAEALMFDAWTMRTSYQFSTNLKYLKYEPTDVLVVNNKILRITKKTLSGSNIIKWDAVAEDSSVYTQAQLAGVPNSFSNQVISSNSESELILLDTALLRDEDDTVGYYAAGGPVTSGKWLGETVFRSVDNGSSFSSIATINGQSAIGSSITMLGNFSGCNTFDELNTVTIIVDNPVTLSSMPESSILNGLNVCLLGSEILQFKNATLVSPKTYLLSGFLRGRKGTEWAINTHTAVDSFVMLSAGGIVRVNESASNLYISRVFKGVTFGSSLASAGTQTFTNNGVCLKPYAPVQLGGGRNAAFDVIITWVRRSRVNGAWLNFIDTPIGEVSELYDIEIWDSGYTTLKRTFSSVTSATVTYTSSQQISDFGSNQSTVYIRVYQLSEIVGRGYKLEGFV